MAMNFFDHQDVARKKTRWLSYAYAFTLLLIVLAVHFLVMMLLSGTAKKTGLRFETSAWQDLGFQFRVISLVASGVLLTVYIGSAIKKRELRAGGPAIAEWLGGRQIFHGAKDPLERRIWNVVEEMAIASGTPVPAVYLLDDEKGINAFAAGVTVDSAVIGITRGCAKELSRDELQGVVAHEFSHITHGDMRLNMKLIGTLAGITLLSHVGYVLMRSVAGGGSSRGRSSGKGEGGAVVFIVLFGLGLYLAGAIGALAASLIQAAISRQREFLADASAVQFTRNPDGIAGALRTIGNFAAGSKLESSRAGEVRHMFFGQGLWTAFATHPPLDLRIGRIEQGWEATTAGYQGSASGPGTAGLAGFAGASPAATETRDGAVALLATIGEPNEAHVRYAHEIISQIPGALRSAVGECFSARCVVYCLLIDKDKAIRKSQLKELAGLTDSTSVKTCRELLPELDGLAVHLRVPLLDIAKGVLKEMTGGQFKVFKETIDSLIKSDERLDLFEWMVKKSLVSHLERHFGAKVPPLRNNKKLNSCPDEIARLLSTMAHAGHKKAEEATASYRSAVKLLDGTGYTMLPRKACSLSKLDRAMEQVARLRPQAKQQLLGACVQSIAADGQVSQMEAELLRVFSEMLDCPVPPLLPGQTFVVE